MSERDLWWKISIVGVLVALAGVTIWPLNQKLKYGIDLYGGYSLLYEIDDSNLSPSEKSTLSERVMTVLRERVDPKGVFNLVWRPVGHNRLEIQMPRPSEEITRARTEFKALQEQLQATVLRRTDLLRAVAKTGPDRTTAFAALTRGQDNRLPLLESMGKAYDTFKAEESQYEARRKEAEPDMLTEAQLEEAFRRSLADRPAALSALARGSAERKPLLEEAAKAWDAYQVARAASQPAAGAASATASGADLFSKENAYQEAVRKVLALNESAVAAKGGPTLDSVMSQEEKLDAAIAAILATNVDLGQLQVLLDAKPRDAVRADALKKLKDNCPGLAPVFDSIVQVSDRLKVQRRGEGRLEDPADLQRLLRGAGVLEFRILCRQDPNDPGRFESYREQLHKRGTKPAPGEENYEWFEIEDPADFLRNKDLAKDFATLKNQVPVVVDRYGDKYFVLARIGDNYALTHRYGQTDWALRGAYPDRDEYGKPSIAFQLDERGGDKFANMTRINKGEFLCIFLDDQAISYATIQSVIRTSGRITGNFTVAEVQEMVKKLNAGSLPKKLKDPPISVRAIGPSLGEANRAAGLTAGKFGAVAVVVFMVGYYFYAGAVAVIAVAMNLMFTLAVMALMGATLTLPGIAGLVLSIGMAVDANVLINERIREELEKGTAIRMAVKLGYERAFSAILDSNLTTLLTCVILYFLGSEEIKGFGLTLGIGVVLNLFTAVYVTKMFFEVMTAFTLTSELKRYPVALAAGIAAAGAALYGLGYAWNAPDVRDQSVLMAFGKALVFIAPVMIGLLLVMFLARAIHLSFQQGPRTRMPMLRIIGVPNLNWLGYRPVFFLFSGLITIGGLLAFFSLDKDELYDIEFLGGTAAQIDLKTPGSLGQTQISERLDASGDRLIQFASALANATVSGEGESFTLKTPGVPAGRLEPVIREVLDPPGNKRLSETDAIRYASPGAEEVVIRVKPDAKLKLEDIKQFVANDFPTKFRKAGESIKRAQVQGVQALSSLQEKDRSFEIVTLESNKELVVGAIMDGLENDLAVQRALTFTVRTDEGAGAVPYFAIRSEDARQCGLPLTGSQLAGVDLTGWKGGVAMILEQMDPPQKLETLRTRLRAMRLQPGFETHGWRESDVFGLATSAPGSDLYSSVMVVVADENYPLEDQAGTISPTWVSELAEPEVNLIKAALTRQTSLSQITSFNEQVSGEAKTNAYIAVTLSWLVIIIYVWFRFGNIRWGMAAVVALIHDVIVAIGFLAFAHYIADTAIGRALLFDKFRVDLALVAAMLTVIGYSVNDTIVVFDRIRENRGRLSEVTPEIVNNSISQTLARTLLTGTTTMFTILIMYIFGGSGIHGFNFVMFIGILTGTYSSFAIASQLLLRRRMAAAMAR